MPGRPGGLKRTPTFLGKSESDREPVQPCRDHHRNSLAPVPYLEEERLLLEIGAQGMRPRQMAMPTLLTVTLTEEQCKYLGAMFQERLESHEIREKSGYPQDEEGARFASELLEAFLRASPEDRNIQEDRHTQHNDDDDTMSGMPGIENGQPAQHSGPQGPQSWHLGMRETPMTEGSRRMLRR